MTYGRSKRQVAPFVGECPQISTPVVLLVICVLPICHIPNGINRLKVLASENNISAFKTLNFSLRFVQIAHFLVELTKSKLPIEEIRRMNLYVESLSESGMGEGCSKFRHNGLIADLKLGTYCLYCVHNTN